MATSVSNTAYGIIDDALHDAGWIQLGQRPNSEQLAVNLRRLNDLVNMWQTLGIKLFLQEEINVTLVANQGIYVIGPGGDVDMTKPERILSGYITVAGSNTRRQLTIISRSDYDLLSQVVGNEGAINQFFVDKQQTVLNLSVWPPPDTTDAGNTATFLMQIQSPNPANLTDSSGFPQEWRLALRWGLADEVCTGQPESIMQRCQQRAQMYREALENWDVEDAPTSFAVDTTRMQGYGRFR
jgi:hypothetical protein